MVNVSAAMRPISHDVKIGAAQKFYLYAKFICYVDGITLIVDEIYIHKNLLFSKLTTLFVFQASLDNKGKQIWYTQIDRVKT